MAYFSLPFLSQARQKPMPGVVRLDYGHPLAAGLQSAFLFNASGSLTVQDYGARMKAGTLTSTITWASGQGGPCASYTGAQNLGLSTYAHVPLPLSIAIQFASTDGSSPCLVDHGDTVTAGFRFNMGAPFTGGSAGAVSFRLSGAGGTAATSTNYNDGNWHIAVVTHNGATCSYYKDGAPDGTPADASSSTSTTAALHIGDRFNGAGDDSLFNGKIAFVYIWSRLLSAGEVAMFTEAPYAMFQTRPLQRYTTWLAVRRLRALMGAGA